MKKKEKLKGNKKINKKDTFEKTYMQQVCKEYH